MTEEVVGKRMTAKQVADLNLHCDLVDLINKQAWPHGEKIATQLLKNYTVTKKSSSRVRESTES